VFPCELGDFPAFVQLGKILAYRMAELVKHPHYAQNPSMSAIA
jgi:hypothetical protein